MCLFRYLLEQGADPHVMDVEMNISLHWAAFSGSKTITDLLLSAGCNVNQANAIGNILLTRLGFKEHEYFIYVYKTVELSLILHV